ncbi:MAG TPA: hypothetical protein VFN34_06310 [Ornithinibacter sp.]|jgi:hypothetical protein|nr:hypothetical protein [Ornithinibacter sp.]
MPRFTWVAWGLLIAVLDLYLAAWDVVPDVVGYAWLAAGLAGAATADPAFVMARTAAFLGIPVGLVTGTPISHWNFWISTVCVVLEVVVLAVVIHQLCTGVLRSAPADDADTRTWAGRLRVGAVVVGVVGLLSIGGALAGFAVLLLVNQLVVTVVGVLTVVLLQRVGRAGWLAEA